MTLPLNKWNEVEVERAENTWGDKIPRHLMKMYNFLIDGSDSWLDLGCGFGRFLEYLEHLLAVPNYTGYDSSASMIKRIKTRFPHHSEKIFHRDISDHHSSYHTADGVLCAAVLIHLPAKEQDRVLEGVVRLNPPKFAFDINCYEEGMATKQPVRTERVINRRFRGTESVFRMTWQSHYAMTAKILEMFPGYQLSMGFYKLHKIRHKVIYMLERGRNGNSGE